MRLLVVYIVILAIGGVVCVAVGNFTDHVDIRYGLIAFLTLFFINLWVSWRIAVALTGPKRLFGGA